MTYPRGFYSRLYLPHFEGGPITQFATFCLWDAVPRVLLRRWEEELRLLTKTEQEIERRRRIEAYLDRGEGQAWLKIPALADLVQHAFQFFHQQRYDLHAWVIMPNHGHVLFTPREGYAMGSILHSWKSYTSNKANEYLGKQGEFWFPESFDRYIRNSEHYFRVRQYIENNPVKAHLCRRPEDWQWSSAYWRCFRTDFHFGDP